MKSLTGLIRRININGDSSMLEGPNLYYKCLGEVVEYAVEINDVCQELIDYLEQSSEHFKENEDDLRIISLSVLDERLEQEVMNIMGKMLEKAVNDSADFFTQLNHLIGECDAIVCLSGLEDSNLFLMFTID